MQSSLDIIETINKENEENIKTRAKVLSAQHLSTPVLLDLKSCLDTITNYPNTSTTTGYYYINDTLLYCEMEDLCDAEGGWTRIGHLDMMTNGEKCPDNMTLYESGNVKGCGRPDGSTTCVSTLLSSNGISYSKVCGKVMGYQYGLPDGIKTHDSIDSPYLDGISVTHGSPRNHIWSFIAGLYESLYSSSNCPCNSPSPPPVTGKSPPTFVGNDYFCESGNPNTEFIAAQFYKDDPLWDGKGCGSQEGNCCSASGLPWFLKTLDSSTTDFIELRNCGDSLASNENIYVSFYEIYVK